MRMLSFIDAIPARNTVRRGESLNVLGGAANSGSALEADISVWANDGNGWRALTTQRFAIAGGGNTSISISRCARQRFPANSGVRRRRNWSW